MNTVLLYSLSDKSIFQFVGVMHLLSVISANAAL